MTTEPTRILWLSDIHFRECYKKNDLVKGFISSFIKQVETDFPHDNPDKKIDYIYLGGDIAFSGQTEEYQKFKKQILIPLLDATGLSIANVISVAGNHDVRWKEFTDIFWKNRDTLATDLKKKNSFLNKNKPDFEALFENYRTLFGDLDDGKEYPKNRLHGHFVDIERRIIFFLLNTAWFSVSTKIDELVNSEPDGEKKLNILKQYTNEYGGQVVGVDFDVWKDIDDVLNTYEGYTKITCLHHPIHWLHWDEIYDYSPSSGAFKLVSKLVNVSDLLITGHEHVPIYIKPKKILDGPWHIEAGMFLEDNAKFEDADAKKERFPHNRFSVLEISKTEIKELRYVYEKLDNSGSWVHKDRYDNTLPLKPKNEKPLEQSDLDQKKTDFYAAITK